MHSFPLKALPIDENKKGDASVWKRDFPVFSIQNELTYFDSAATCLMPKAVADAIHHYLCFEHANSHKGLYPLSAIATEKVEKSRANVANFIGAVNSNEIIFTTSTTHAINQIAQGYVKKKIADLAKVSKVANIVVSESEHHANLLPWQNLVQEFEAELRIAPISQNGSVDLESLALLIDENSVIVAINHFSNVLGCSNPINEVCQISHELSVPVLVDGAQAVGHINVDVQALSCDFYTFSAHKMYGPTGIGILYSKAIYLDEMQPLIVGGGIVSKTSYNEYHLLPAPLKFEAGSHNVAAIVGLNAAIEYLSETSQVDRQNYLKQLSLYLFAELNKLSFVRPLIPFEYLTYAPFILSFVVEGVHGHDIATMLAEENIAVRAGHHCAEPLHRKLSLNTSIRVSLGIYNNFSDIDRLVISLKKSYQLLSLN